MVNCHFPLWAQTNHILEQISISPLEWYGAQWKAQSRRYPIPFHGLLHLGVDKDILCPGIKRNDSMTVDLSGWRCFYLSPNFQYFPIVHKIIVHVAFSDPSQTHTASPNSISQLTASCLPLDPLFSPRNSSTLFPLCWACAFYWLLFSFLTPVPVRMPPPQALWNVLHCFPVCTVKVHISPQCLHAKPSLLCVPFPLVPWAQALEKTGKAGPLSDQQVSELSDMIRLWKPQFPYVQNELTWTSSWSG